ncbi:MAG: IS1634 family transposase [Deltaproteobacteria bacterium]|nr:IS1634 family transposase [Deltaproteobacteria bacterium]
MATRVIKNVQTQAVGFAPILRHYFDQCGITNIIDDHVELDPRRKILTHGQATVAMITAILFQVMQLYRLCKFATEKNVLKVLLPQIEADQYFDDRLADTLDALFDYGIGDLDMLITGNMIEVFKIESQVCHNDTTSVSMYGDADNNKTDQSIKITYGHSKKHRKDLKQFVWSMSVSSDHAFPLFQQAYSGNTADVTTYVEQWQRLIDLLGRQDFLYVGDSKLISHQTMAHIHDNGGFFVAPAPMYESYKKVFEDALDSHDRQYLISYKGRFNRGFEVPMDFKYEDKDYRLRMIILFDHGLCARKQKTLQSRINRTLTEFEQISGKLNRYKLKNNEAIDNACSAILKKNHTEAFFTYHIINEPITTYKNKHRGRPSKKVKPEQVAVVQDHFKVELTLDQNALDQAISRCGYYPLLTNQSTEQLSIQGAMLAHKKQYKSEHTFRRAKGPYSIEPVYLHTPERIEAFLLLFKIALQMVVLIERTARKNIRERDYGLDDFMPNRADVRNPRSEFMLKEFEDIVKGEMPLPDGNTYGFVSELNALQRDILSVLKVPLYYYDYRYLFDSS